MNASFDILSPRCVAGLGLLCCSLSLADGAAFSAAEQAELWLPDLVSTPLSEVRITFSPDGRRMLWGAIGWSGGPGEWDIFESRRTAEGWTSPQPVSFNSALNDFDPSFAPDGSGVYFFSNRSGGQGKDDLYFAAFDPAGGTYAAALNLGRDINTSGDEWAPVVSPDGRRLMFASDGRGGRGKHDLFVAEKSGAQWGKVAPIAELNSAEEDFDATFLEDSRSIVFSRGDFEGTVLLYVAPYVEGRLQAPQKLPVAINSEQTDAWTFGPAISLHEPGVLYFTSHHAEHRGRADIYRIEYRLAK